MGRYHVQIVKNERCYSSCFLCLDSCCHCCWSLLRRNATFHDLSLSRHFKKTVVFLWVWSIASATYYVRLAKLEIRTGGHYHCNLNTFPVEKKHADAWRAIAIFELLLNFFLPLLLIIVLYSIVCLKLWSRDIPGEGTNQNERQAEALKIAKKVTRMMIAVVVLYLLCWLPFFVMFSRSFLRYGYVNENPNLLLFIVWLTVAYSGLNPYVYLTFSQKFRNGFKLLFEDCLGKVHNFLSARSQSVELEQI